MPQKQRNGPPPIAGRSESQVATTATITALPIIRGATLTARAQRRDGALVARANVFAPHGRRTWWWFTYACDTCAAYHFGRAPSLGDVTGQRKAGCGHLVVIEVAQILGYPDPGAAA